MFRTVLLIGAFDVKAEEFAFVRRLILARGHQVLTMNVGVMGGTDLFPIDIDADQVAAAAGESLESLRTAKDRGRALEVLGKGASVLVGRLLAERRFDGVLGMGGSGGSGMAAAAMRVLPLGMPKVLVSTLASGDTSPLIGFKDITLIPSVVDVAGVNGVSEKIFKQAAGAICGMIEMDYASVSATRPLVAASMFGNTTRCVDACRQELDRLGYEVLVFHAVGTGGRAMESLIGEGVVSAVLDITTTEWADELCGGVFTAGPERLDAPGKLGLPHLIVPGCLDMVNFGPRETVPAKYADRQLYVWGPTVTLMRTNVEENRRLGEILARKANAAQGPVAFLLPLKGVSMLDSPGERFWWPEADAALFDAIRNHVRPGIPVVELDCNINDAEFSQRAVAMLMELIGQAQPKA